MGQSSPLAVAIKEAGRLGLGPGRLSPAGWAVVGPAPLAPLEQPHPPGRRKNGRGRSQGRIYIQHIHPFPSQVRGGRRKRAGGVLKSRGQKIKNTEILPSGEGTGL